MANKSRAQISVENANIDVFISEVKTAKTLKKTLINEKVKNWLRPGYESLQSVVYKEDGKTLSDDLQWTKMAECFEKSGGGKINARTLKKAFDDLSKEMPKPGEKKPAPAAPPGELQPKTRVEQGQGGNAKGGVA